MRRILHGPSPHAAPRRLPIGDASGRSEREADATADRVLRAAGPAALPTARARSDFEGAGLQASPRVTAEIESSLGRGRPLPVETRERFEVGLGRDLGPVRVHADARAGRLSSALQARAFTVGSDVFFGHGRYAPGTREGDRLLAHELAHVSQQTGGRGFVQRFKESGAWSLGSANVEVEAGDNLWTLAILITTKGADWTQLGISKSIQPGQIVDVTPLIELLDKRIRAGIVSASAVLLTTAQFPSAGQAFFDGSGGDQVKVESFFKDPPVGGSKPLCDCLGAGYLVWSKAVIGVMHGGEFDALYNSKSIPEIYTGADQSAMKVGDWSYIRNDSRYLSKHPGGGYQGENVIKLGADRFWGFPIGTKSYADWEAELIAAYNRGLPAAERVTSIPGFDSARTTSVDSAKIALDLFRHRKP